MCVGVCGGRGEVPLTRREVSYSVSAVNYPNLHLPVMRDNDERVCGCGYACVNRMCGHRSSG